MSKIISLLLLLLITVLRGQQYDIFNALLADNNIAPSLSISKCFTPPEEAKILPTFEVMLSKAINGGLGELLSLSNDINIFFYNTLSLPTRKCLQNNHEIQLLFRKYNNQNWTSMNSSYSSFIYNNFLQARYYFLNMSSYYSAKQWTELGRYMSMAGHRVYGADPGDNDEWLKRVERVEGLKEYYGVSVGNGVLGVVSSQEPLRTSATVLAGVYDKYGRGRVDNIIQTFDGINIEINPRESSSRKYNNLVQQVNMKEGSFSGAYGTEFYSLNYTYYALKNLPFATLAMVTINAMTNFSVEIKSLLEAPEYMQQVQHYFEHLNVAEKIYPIITSKGTSQTGKLDLVTSSTFVFNSDTQFPSVLHQMWHSDMHLLKFDKTFGKGQTFTFGVFSCSLSNIHHPDPQNEAVRVVLRGGSVTPAQLVAAHKKLWDKQWETDIIIEGNADDQKDVRFMLYHMYSFTHPAVKYGLSPMGLSGLGYNGHVFWDMDLWMYPGLLALDPSLAKTMVQYRYERLEGAVNNAFINGYKGAMYPWESSKDGTEETPVWALSGPLEHHITGCVALAAWNYYAVTQDVDWLREKGYPVIQKAAEFWESRVQLINGQYHILNVVGADEWAENINDDAFTNGVAKFTLKTANKVAKILDLAQNSAWDDIARKIVILKFPDNTTKEHETYRGQNIKQADVNLLSYPLKQVTLPQDIMRDLKYYQVRVPDQGTPAMTYSIFTILYSRLNDSANAYKNFQGSYKPYLRGPFGVFSETKGGTNPYFMTGAGGVLQSVIYGFGGYDITDGGIVKVNSVLPKEWSRLTIKSKTSVSALTETEISARTYHRISKSEILYS